MSYVHLTLSERETIAQMRFAGHGPTFIGNTLGRSPGTISREISRNSTNGRYRSHDAHRKSLSRRSERPLTRKLDHSPLVDEIDRLLSCCWSPDEVAGRLKLEHFDDRRMHVSHQTIYRWLWSNPEAYADFRPNLRHGRYHRRGRKRRVVIKNRVSIHARPLVVEQRSRLGDWEGDTIVGKGHRGYVATFVDRRSGYLVASRMRDKRSISLNRAAIRAFGEVPSSARLSLTVDNGTEFAKHEQLSRQLGMSIYFADTYSSWQRGTNENTNGLLRQFVPKSQNILDLSPTALAFHVDRLNNRPRKRLGYQTPNEVFHQQTKVALQV
ncbi:MAG TPA: IS30 family transposase [Gammaproteobacteria bacterium]|nr:IS30 family transposase [Gammaproteobacteria bacterium]